MNVHDRAAAYAEFRRVLSPGGRLAFYDVIAADDKVDLVYPVPWAPRPELSHLLTQAETVAALAAAGFTLREWNDVTVLALNWLGQTPSAPQGSLSLAAVMGSVSARWPRTCRSIFVTGVPDLPWACSNLRQAQKAIDIRCRQSGVEVMLATLENRVPPPMVMAGTALLMWGGSALAPGGLQSTPLRIAALAICLLAGLALAGTGLVAFRRAGTTIDPTRPESASIIVTSGIYRWTRNPMYLGFTCVLVGWALWLASWWALFGPVVFVAWITRLQIVPEERALRRRFGASYDAYCRVVRRWL